MLNKLIAEIALLAFMFISVAHADDELFEPEQPEPALIPLKFSTYSKQLHLLPLTQYLGAEFAGQVKISGWLWIESLGNTAAYFLIPDAYSRKILPHVVGVGTGNSHPVPIKKIYILTINTDHIPESLSQAERSKLVDELYAQWDVKILTQLLGAHEASTLIKRKPAVVKIPVVAVINHFFTGVSCDQRGYGAKIVSIRIMSSTGNRQVATSNHTRFEGC